MEPGLSIIVPVYNGAGHLGALYSELSPVLDRFQAELILVNDGSRDESLEAMKKIHERDGRVRVLSFTENRGQQSALFSALKYCRAPLIATMDDDLQHPPELLDRMTELCRSEYDLIYAVPETDNRGFLYRTGTGLTRVTFSLLTGKPLRVKTGSFRVFRRGLIETLAQSSPPFPYLSALMFKNNRQIQASHVYFETNSRETNSRETNSQKTNSRNSDQPGEKRKGTSRYTPGKLIKIYLRLFLFFGPLSSLAALLSAEKDYTPQEVFG